MATCVTCGNEFVPAWGTTGRFCTRPCYWRGKLPLRPLAERFWSKVDKSDDCWLWTGGHHNGGYGVIGLPDGNVGLTHRVSWEMHFGKVPPGLHVCHKCDVRGCVRPSHLFLGTNADNVADKVAKGRQPRGETSGPRMHPDRIPRGAALPQAKLTELRVQQMRQQYAGGKLRMIDLAESFGISLAAVHGVIHRRTWKHVP